MAGAIEHTYRYAFPSALDATDRSAAVRLATSGGQSEFPYFFQGQLAQPRLTGQALRVLSRTVASRFHIPAAMLAKILRESDPVVTCGGEMLRFEGFSACCSVYARVDLSPGAYSGVFVGQGTTNVDFNGEMRAALSRLRDNESVSLAVGAEDVTLLRGEEPVAERKVALPVRWLKSFVEVQAYQSRMELRLEIGKAETIRFLRSIPKGAASRTVFWIHRAGRGVRASQRKAEGAVRLAGIQRLRLLEDLAPLAQGLRVFADVDGTASEWHLQLGPVTLCLTVSAEVWRGFSGEGQALGDLAAGDREQILNQTRGLLKWQSEIHPKEFRANWDVDDATLRRALSVLGSRGLVGYDLARGAWFHRELPFDLAQVEQLHPRLKNARKLIEKGAVRLIGESEAEVAGTDVTHRVRLRADGASCTCPWHSKHQSSRGPCKHILATQILVETGLESKPD